MSPGVPAPVRFASPRRLHKDSSEAYTGILAAVSVCTAECHSVCVTRVLDASRNLIVLVLCWLFRLRHARLAGDSSRAAVILARTATFRSRSCCG